MKLTSRRWFAAGGIVGPVTFVAAWAFLGTGRARYSPVNDPISRLAAVGTPSHVAMTFAFIVFAAGVGLYSIPLRARLPGAAGAAAVTTAATTLAVAFFPLGSRLGDQPHAIAASSAYVALVALLFIGG
ncbi:MAG: DUF998 domain-containing protein [Acidobacteria bacterium]|nr:DUF998 domain-containing protein [Acidobacteriota bacterium]